MDVLESAQGRPSVGPLLPGDATRVTCSELEDGTILVTASEDAGRPGVRLEVDLGDAVGYWQPGSRGSRALPPEWSEASVTSLVASAPLGALYNAAGQVLVGWAAAEPIVELSVRYGVSEERKTFVVEVRPVVPLDHDLVLLLDYRRGALAPVAHALATWMSSQCIGSPRVAPSFTGEPVYSTWYTFTQDIDHTSVISEAEFAIPLGFRSIFIDDGWQRLAKGRGYQGCGDWLPDTTKFPDLAGTTAALHGLGAKVGLWIAPLLLGAESEAFDIIGRCATQRQDILNCSVLDPRIRQVREHVAATCLRLVDDFNVDLLKIDFLDQAMIYKLQAGPGDIDDVGQAMAHMLDGVRQSLDAAGHSQVAFEFRQPYVSPAIARHGEVLRANDCPGDSATNRASTIDARLISTGQMVHTDPMMWGTTGGAEAVAQQLYAGWFGVPQVSMRLDDLPADQREALGGLIALWRQMSLVVIEGDLTVSGAERGYDLVSATNTSMDRSVIARYAPLTIEIGQDATGETTLLNATPETRIALRLFRRLESGVTRSAKGIQIATIAPTGPGLIELDVPAFGTITLMTSPH